MAKRVASLVHKQASRLLREGYIKKEPAWLQAVIDHPPISLPPRDPPSRSAFDLPPVVSTTTSKALAHANGRPPSRPARVQYIEDQIRRQFFEDHPFEVFRPTTLVEELTIVEEHPIRGKDWTRLRQRGRNPTPEECVYSVTCHYAADRLSQCRPLCCQSLYKPRSPYFARVCYSRGTVPCPTLGTYVHEALRTHGGAPLWHRVRAVPGRHQLPEGRESSRHVRSAPRTAHGREHGEEEVEGHCREGVAAGVVDEGPRVYATLAAGGAAKLRAATVTAAGCPFTANAYTRGANTAGEGAEGQKYRQLQYASSGAGTTLVHLLVYILRSIILVINGLVCFVPPSPVQHEHVHCGRY